MIGSKHEKSDRLVAALLGVFAGIGGPEHGDFTIVIARTLAHVRNGSRGIMSNRSVHTIWHGEAEVEPKLDQRRRSPRIQPPGYLSLRQAVHPSGGHWARGVELAPALRGRPL